MKINIVGKKFKMVQSMAGIFFRQHHQTLNAIGKIYQRSISSNRDLPGRECIQTLEFVRYGHLYRIILRTFVGQEYVHSQSWLATYCWHTGGHLSEIGGRHRQYIFDQTHKVVYVDPEDCDAELELFYEIPKP